MAYRTTDFIFNRQTDTTGVVNSDDVLQIVQDNVDTESEFYEIEPAIVNEVFLDPKDLPVNEDGFRDYSIYGTIKARFSKSQQAGDVISSYIKPLSPHIVVYPIVGEMVNVANYNGQLFYYSPLNLHNKVNMNRGRGVRIDGVVKDGITKYNRIFASKKGDININGRFGQGIKFSSNENHKFPIIKITNGQNNDRRKFLDTNHPHIQNINYDGSTIMMSSGELRNKNDILIPSADSKWWPAKWKTSIKTNLIALNSDNLIFNAKGKKGDIHLSANRTVSLASNFSITLEAGKTGVINLGDADTNNPILKGDQTGDLFKEIFAALSNFSNTLVASSGFSEIKGASEELSRVIGLIEKNKLPKIYSKTVYITEEKD